jgi:N-acetylglucosamine kinase-like BadF-type ATPase
MRASVASGANWTVHGADACAERIGDAVAAALPARARPRSLCLCIAGYYPAEHQSAAAAWAARAWPGSRCRIEPDYLAACAGAHGGGPGIVVICGTGSIAYGRNAAGEEARAGGWGPLFGDEGSAYHLGLLTLRALAREVDAAEPPSPDTGWLLQRWPELGGEPCSWLRGVYREGWGREEIALLGGALAERGDAGDPVVQQRLAACAAHLADLAYQVHRRLSPPRKGRRTRVALQGGLGEGCRTLRACFARILRDRWKSARDPGYRMKLVDGRHAPVQGALLLAAEATGDDDLAAAVRRALHG